VARELTKLHEEFIRGTLDEISATIEPRDVRGEIVLLIGPQTKDAATGSKQATPQSIAEEVAALVRDEQLDQKAALKRVARARGLSKSEAYRQLLAERAAADVPVEVTSDDVE